MENFPGLPDQSALTPANFTTLADFSVSSTRSLPKSAGEPGRAVAPNSANRAFILGSARAALISLLSLSTISAGVLFGAPTPVQKLDSYAGTNSATVGMSGSTGERVAVVTASARSLPPLTYSIDEDMVANIDGIVDRRYNNRNGARCLPQCPDDWRRMGDDYVRRERHQFCCVSSYEAGVGPTKACLDLDVAAVSPS